MARFMGRLRYPIKMSLASRYFYNVMSKIKGGNYIGMIFIGFELVDSFPFTQMPRFHLLGSLEMSITYLCVKV